MGLDMYLFAKKYTSKYSEKKDKVLNEKLWKLFKLEKGDNLSSCEVKFECGYWRKSNQIHNWFVENTQKGEDNCQESDVSREQLLELKELCLEVLDIISKKKLKTINSINRFTKEEEKIKVYPDTKEIEDLLPTQKGFFFGGYEIDEWYKDDLENTIQIINKCLKDFPEKDSWDFSYRASW